MKIGFYIENVYLLLLDVSTIWTTVVFWLIHVYLLLFFKKIISFVYTKKTLQNRKVNNFVSWLFLSYEHIVVNFAESFEVYESIYRVLKKNKKKNLFEMCTGCFRKIYMIS